MKLLLTSFGITNDSLANSLEKLAGKPRKEIKIGFIPTAGNVEPGNKDWFIPQLTNLSKHGFSWVDLIDISSVGVDWRKRLEVVDVIFMAGGNTFYLLDQVRKTGFDKWLKQNLSKKVYVGSSAGSIIATPAIAVAGLEPPDENIPDLKDLTGMKLVQFEVSPHTPESVSYQTNQDYAQTTDNDLICLDDQSAVEVIDEKTNLVSGGEWRKL